MGLLSRQFLGSLEFVFVPSGRVMDHLCSIPGISGKRLGAAARRVSPKSDADDFPPLYPLKGTFAAARTYKSAHLLTFNRRPAIVGNPASGLEPLLGVGRTQLLL